MIPCCFHPTKVVIVDDNYEFLKRLDATVSRDHTTYMYYNQPQKALGFFNEIYRPDPFPNRYVLNTDEEKWEHRHLDINIFDLHQEIYRPQRFEQISVVVADYSMPEMNGLEFLQQIHPPHIQKILLTGEANEHLAIEAFNQGWIHHYIRKQDPMMAQKLRQAIRDAQWRYFTHLSAVTIEAIRSVDIVDHAVTDPHFHAFFKELMHEHNFIEAYLCESMGSYFFLDAAGQNYGLMVNIEEQLDLWAESDKAQRVNSKLREDLKTYKKMMCYHNTDGFLEPLVKDWPLYAHPAQTLQGQKTTYYYAFAPDIFDIDTSRIAHFAAAKGEHGEFVG
jgi:CheY-like chemotaxis protein